MTCAALPIASPAAVTSGYGWRNRPSGPDLHTGIDLGAPRGTPVYAMLPGVVVVSAPSGELSGYGDVIVVQHGSALYALYAHLDRRSVARGAVVAPGQQLGAVGTSAGTRADPQKQFASSSSHLHLEFLNRWPPAGPDLDRLDVGQVLAALGVIVPPSGPLVQACTTTSRAPMVVRASTGSAAALLLFVALAAAFGR
jgi:murein DD-endopeptidase MepM/ murein hydrolase activator NlpD